MATESEITNILKVLASAYPNFTIHPSTGKLYLDLLMDVPGKLLGAAALEHISRSSYFPTIAELRQTAFDLLRSQPGQPPDAHSAWTEVLQAFDRTGYLEQPTFSDPLIAEAVKALDWQALCRSDNPISDRSHFVQVYQALLEQRKFAVRRSPEVQKRLLAHQAASVPQLTEG